MATRWYSQINSSITGSRKFRGLDHKARWAWLCAHLKADYAGIAEYLEAQWALDVELSADELATAIQSLARAKLIEWYPAGGIVRITGFIKQRPPDNASAALRLCMDLTDRLYKADGEHEEMLLAASAEFVVATVKRSMRWNKDREKFRDDIGQFVRGTAQDFGDNFLDAIDAEMKGASRPVRSELEGVLPSLLHRKQKKVAPPSAHPVDTRYVDKTRHKPDSKEYANANDAIISNQTKSSVQTASEQENSRGDLDQDGSKCGPTEATKSSALAAQSRMDCE